MAYDSHHYVPKKERPPMIKGKAASTNAGFQENISRERRLGDSMKQAAKVAYKEAENGLKMSPAKKHRHGKL